MELLKISSEEAKKIIDSGCDCYLVLSHDLEKDISLGKRRINKKKGKVLVMDSKTIVLNKEEEEEDSFSILSLYSAFQKDIRHIRPLGVKHDMILLSPVIHEEHLF